MLRTGNITRQGIRTLLSDTMDDLQTEKNEELNNLAGTDIMVLIIIMFGNSYLSSKN